MNDYLIIKEPKSKHKGGMHTFLLIVSALTQHDAEEKAISQDPMNFNNNDPCYCKTRAILLERIKNTTFSI